MKAFREIIADALVSDRRPDGSASPTMMAMALVIVDKGIAEAERLGYKIMPPSSAVH